MRVFWPTKGLKKKTTSGTAVGWREGDNIVVVAVVDKVGTASAFPEMRWD